jgi:hypothetical protein
MAWSLIVPATLGAVLAVLAVLGLQRRRAKKATNRSGSSRPPLAAEKGPSEVAKRGKPEPAAVKSCPVCLGEFSPKNRFCVRDGAELTDGRSEGSFAQGMICPTCRRGYPFDSRFCPEDADDLVPYGLFGAASATRPSLRLDANKICPECGVRHAPAHSFCGNDGTELVVVN